MALDAVRLGTRHADRDERAPAFAECCQGRPRRPGGNADDGDADGLVQPDPPAGSVGP